MREIKFRGWHTYHKKMFSAEEMAQDQLTLLPTGQFINVNGQSVRLSTIFSQDEFIPLRFTSFKDKNGEEIYEGDIVKLYDSAVGAVEFFYGAWQIQNGEKAGGQLGSISIDHIEVVGNIYESPELLKE